MSIVASSPQCVGSTALAPKTFKDKNGTVRWRIRRPSRGRETTPAVVLRALPKGMHQPTHTDQWITALKSHPDYDHLRQDLKTALLRCGELLAKVADFTSMTTRPTWNFLATALGVTRRSVARYLQQLRRMRLLGVVASGRLAEHAAAGPDGKKMNEAAVYVLCQPIPRTVSRAMHHPLSPSVDESVTPPNFVGKSYSSKEVNPYTRVRARGSKSKEQRKLGCSVDQIRWNKHWVPQTKAQRCTAAWRLRRLIPNVFGSMSDRDLAATLKEFFASEWSVADVHHALDIQPDGTPWPHSGAPNTKSPHRVRGWIKYRLAAWRDPQGCPIKSKAQQLHERREVIEQNRRLEAEQTARRKAEVQACPPEVKNTALADIRQILSQPSMSR